MFEKIKSIISPYEVTKHTVSPIDSLPNFEGYTYIKYCLFSKQMLTFDGGVITISDWYRCTRRTPKSDTWTVQHFRSEPQYSQGHLIGKYLYKSTHHQSTAELSNHIINLCQNRELQLILSKKRIDK